MIKIDKNSLKVLGRKSATRVNLEDEANAAIKEKVDALKVAIEAKYPQDNPVKTLKKSN